MAKNRQAQSKRSVSSTAVLCSAEQLRFVEPPLLVSVHEPQIVEKKYVVDADTIRVKTTTQLSERQTVSFLWCRGRRVTRAPLGDASASSWNDSILHLYFIKSTCIWYSVN